MQIHPALERVLGPHLDHPAVVDLLQKYLTPTLLKAAGKARLGTRLIKIAPRMGRRLTEEIFQALSKQTVVVSGTHAPPGRCCRAWPNSWGRCAANARRSPSRSRSSSWRPRWNRSSGACPALVSGPLRVITEISSKEFATAGHLALLHRPGAGDPPIRIFEPRRAPLTSRQQGPQTHGVPLRFRSSQLAARSDPVSRRYYERKIAQGKRHNQALIALAPRRCDALYAMLRDGTLYEVSPPLTT